MKCRHPILIYKNKRLTNKLLKKGFLEEDLIKQPSGSFDTKCHLSIIFKNKED